jgi:hypothetical protein
MRAAWLAILAAAVLGCRGHDVRSEKANNVPMHVAKRMTPVQNTHVQFASFRPPGSRSVSLDRRVQVVAPPELVQLAQTDDVTILDELVELLSDRDRAWAAEVVLAAMTGQEADLVANYSGSPERWLDSQGATAADRWRAWLAAHRARLSWDAEARSFVVK